MRLVRELVRWLGLSLDEDAMDPEQDSIFLDKRGVRGGGVGGEARPSSSSIEILRGSVAIVMILVMIGGIMGGGRKGFQLV